MPGASFNGGFSSTQHAGSLAYMSPPVLPVGGWWLVEAQGCSPSSGEKSYFLASSDSTKMAALPQLCLSLLRGTVGGLSLQH